ncbi:MAG: hypothetical protein V4598_00220 [Bdellovibrionota bacterium]
MKTLLIALLVISACASKNEVREEQQEIQRQEEEVNRTGTSDEMGPGYDYGSTSTRH